MGAAAELLERHPDDRLQAALDLRQAEYLASLSRYEESSEAALSAHRRYLALGDRRGAAQSLYQAGISRITISHNTVGCQLFEQALELYQTVGDTTGETLCLSGLALAELNLGDIELALQHAGRALQLGEQHGDRLGMARASYTLAAAWSFYYHPRYIQEYAQLSLRLYQDLGLELTMYRPMLLLAGAHGIRGELEQARALLERIAVRAGHDHDSWLEGWALQSLGRVALDRGDLRLAEQLLQRAYQLRRESGETQNQISSLAWLARLRLAQGRAGEALDHMHEVAAQLAALSDEIYVWELQDVLLVHAEVLEANGDAAGARRQIEQAYATLMQIAEQITDAGVKQGFLSHPTSARIIAARDAGATTARRPDA
jgi:tetratricopeptide (TPR) repeat protein